MFEQVTSLVAITIASEDGIESFVEMRLPDGIESLVEMRLRKRKGKLWPARKRTLGNELADPFDGPC